MAGFELTGQFLARLYELFELLLPAYLDEGKSGSRSRSAAPAMPPLGVDRGTHGDVVRDALIEPRLRHRDVTK